jgi:class 3 adenylate cyclase
MSETRKIAAILVADVVGYSRLAGADEDRTLSRLRGLRSDLIDPAIAAHRGRIVKRTGDGALVEFRSVVDAVRCAIELQTGLVERNAGIPAERRIEFRIGVHLGDVVEEADGDLMGDGVNIAARLEGVCEPGAICLSEDAYRQIKGKLDLAVRDLGSKELKNIAEPIRVYSLEVGKPSQAKPAPAPAPEKSATPRLSMVHCGEALRLSPRDSYAFAWMTTAGIAKLHLGSYEQAAAWCRRAIEANRNYPLSNFMLGAALAQLGRIAEARSAVKAGLALAPSYAVSRVRADWTAMSDNPAFLAQAEGILEAMRKAGVPEQ